MRKDLVVPTVSLSAATPAEQHNTGWTVGKQKACPWILSDARQTCATTIYCITHFVVCTGLAKCSLLLEVTLILVVGSHWIHLPQPKVWMESKSTLALKFSTWEVHESWSLISDNSWREQNLKARLVCQSGSLHLKMFKGAHRSELLFR